MTRRALVTITGGICGAFGGGALEVVTKEVGGRYGRGYGTSVGVFGLPFYGTGQAREMRRTWLHRVDGNQLVNRWNFIKHKNILDLDRLLGYFQSGESALDLDAFERSGFELTFVASDMDTGKAVYLKPNRDNLFDCMRASAALPIVHSPVILDGRTLGDGGLTDPVPYELALEENDEVLVISNNPFGVHQDFGFKRITRRLMPRIEMKCGDLFRNYDANQARILEEVEEAAKRREIKLIRPERKLPLKGILDTDKDRIAATYEMGMEAAWDFLRRERGLNLL